MDLQRADVEAAARPAECTRGVEAHAQDCQAVIVGSTSYAAGDVAEHLVGLVQTQGNAVSTQDRAQATHVSEQVRPLPEPGRCRGRGRRWRRCDTCLTRHATTCHGRGGRSRLRDGQGRSLSHGGPGLQVTSTDREGKCRERPFPERQPGPWTLKRLAMLQGHSPKGGTCGSWEQTAIRLPARSQERSSPPTTASRPAVTGRRPHRAPVQPTSRS